MSIEKLPAEVIRKHKGVSFVGITVCFFCYHHNEVLLAKRSQNARDEQGTWDTGGGGLKVGETAEECIRRELQEEYAAVPLKIDFLGYRDIFRHLSDGTPTHWLGLDFAVQVDPQEAKNNEPEMIEEIKWFPVGKWPSPLHSQMLIFFKKHEAQIKRIMNEVA